MVRFPLPRVQFVPCDPETRETRQTGLSVVTVERIVQSTASVEMRVSRRFLSSFPALVTRGPAGQVAVERLTEADLPRECLYKQTRGSCDLLVRVEFSTLNYKDALVVSGRYPGLRTPMVAGCDIAGRVVEDRSGRLREGEGVVSNGWGVGTDHYGGFAGLASLRSCWALQLPGGMTSKQAATIGTAGYTAMLCIQAMEDIGLRPGRGPVMVTGATGGVGSVAVLLLAQLGYSVTAVSGKAETEAAYLTALGASEVLDRRQLEGEPRPLGRETYSGCVDSCGGRVLAGLLPLIQYGGVVSACGLASGLALTSTVAPFILRGVTLAGVESALLPLERRRQVYTRFGPLLTEDKLALLSGQFSPGSDRRVMAGVAGEDRTVGLSHLPQLADRMLEGKITGRYVVDLSLE